MSSSRSSPYERSSSGNQDSTTAAISPPRRTRSVALRGPRLGARERGLGVAPASIEKERRWRREIVRTRGSGESSRRRWVITDTWTRHVPAAEGGGRHQRDPLEQPRLLRRYHQREHAPRRRRAPPHSPRRRAAAAAAARGSTTRARRAEQLVEFDAQPGAHRLRRRRRPAAAAQFVHRRRARALVGAPPTAAITAAAAAAPAPPPPRSTIRGS